MRWRTFLPRVYDDGPTAQDAPSPVDAFVGECYDGPERALQLLVDSPPHRAHLLREGWFAGHTVYGVGRKFLFLRGGERAERIEYGVER